MNYWALEGFMGFQWSKTWSSGVYDIFCKQTKLMHAHHNGNIMYGDISLVLTRIFCQILWDLILDFIQVGMFPIAAVNTWNKSNIETTDSDPIGLGLNAHQDASKDSEINACCSSKYNCKGRNGHSRVPCFYVWYTVTYTAAWLDSFCKRITPSCCDAITSLKGDVQENNTARGHLTQKRTKV